VIVNKNLHDKLHKDTYQGQYVCFNQHSM